MHNTEEKRGYKFTEEFGYIPEDWDVYLLSTLGNIQMCRRILQDWTTSNGEIPFYKIGTIGQTPDAFISRTLFEEFRKKYNYPRKSEVLITCSGTIGKCIQFDGKDSYYQDSNIVWLHNNSPSYLSNNFLYYYLSNIEWNSLSSTTITRLYNDDLLNLFLLLPPFFEQEKIAEVLSDIDELIESTQKLIDKKKDLKTATMQKLLTPKPHWVAKKLGEIVKLQGGYSFSSTNFKNVGIPIVRISNIYNNLVILEDDIVYHDEIDLSSCFIINKNDILIAMSGATTGKIGLYCYDNIAYLNQRVGKFIIIDETITNKLFLLQLLKDWKFETLLKKEIAQGAQPNVSSAQIEKMEFMVPVSYTEQQKIAQTLSDMDAEIEALEKELNKYKDLKTGMMQELLTGKKRLV